MALPDYDIVFVGGGYSVATYLLMAELRPFTRIAVIGGTDAWARIIRGDGVLNHRAYLYAQRDRTPVKPQEMPDREDLADDNGTIIDTTLRDLARDRNRIVDNIFGMVTRIERTTYTLQANETIRYQLEGAQVFARGPGETIPVYTLTYKAATHGHSDPRYDAPDVTCTALKVVYGGGAGPHMPPPAGDVPPGARDAILTNVDPNDPRPTRLRYPPNSRLLDLDSFMRIRTTLPPDTRVAVVGPNAGIDAAIGALDAGLDLTWMIRGGWGTRPAWLPTRHYRIEGQAGRQAIERAEACALNYNRVTAAAWTGDAFDSAVRLTLNDPKRLDDGTAPPNDTFEVDYYVFALGQDPSLEEVVGDSLIRVGAAKVLDPVIAADRRLQPIYDRNQRFGRWFETAFGLRDSFGSRFTGLEVIGAAAFGLASRAGGQAVRQAYLSQPAGLVTQASALDRDLQPVRAGDEHDRTVSLRLNRLKTFGAGSAAETVRLLDYFTDQGTIPSVMAAMLNLPARLNQRTVNAGDQLGTIRSQIEGITDFYLIATMAEGQRLAQLCHAFLPASQDALKAISQAAQDADAKVDAMRRSALSLRRYLRLADFVPDYADILEDLEGQPARTQYNDLTTTLLPENLYTLIGHAMQYPNTPQDRGPQIVALVPVSQRLVTNLLAWLQPYNAQESVDFNGMDRTQLTVYLAAAYPEIYPQDWDGIVTKIIIGRAHKPDGYSRADMADIKQQLALFRERPDKAATFTAP